MPLCAGPGYSEADLKAPYATPAQLEALSAKLDSRGYWGSVAEMETGALTYADGYPTEKQAVDALLKWEDCKGAAPCSPIPTPASAWPGGSEGRGTGFTALNTDPSPPAMKRAQPATPRVTA